MTGSEAYALAKRKATYGHKPWIVWSSRSGEWNVAVETPSTIKSAMLSVGTQGRWTSISGRGLSFVQRWRDGARAIRNSKC